MSICVVCGISANLRCSSCNSVYYCGKKHQKEDWKTHKKACICYKMEVNEKLGRFLVANRDLKAGTMIVSKDPLIVGPKMASKPVCLGCHKVIQITIKCGNCNWPLCSKNCQNAIWHRDECPFLAKIANSNAILNAFADDGGCNNKMAAYSVIVPLRTLLLKLKDLKAYNEIMSLESHINSRKHTKLYKILEKTLVPLLKNMQIDLKSDLEPLEICSIFHTNAFEFHNDQINIRTLYPTISLISHDCTTNTKHIFDPLTNKMTIFATTDIKRGEIISTTYTQTLWPTLRRREHLKSAKNFDCTCKRCTDPSELGLFVGSLKCANCRDSLLISEDPLDNDSDWVCSNENCATIIAIQNYKALNEDIRGEIMKTPKKSAEFEELLTNLMNSSLHATNTHALDIKYALVQLYFAEKSLQNSEKRRFKELCEELLEVARVLEPGCSVFNETLQGYLEI